MISDWKLHKLSENSTKVVYTIEFEFKNKLYSSVTSYFLDMLGHNILN